MFLQLRLSFDLLSLLFYDSLLSVFSAVLFVFLFIDYSKLGPTYNFIRGEIYSSEF